MHRYQKQLDTFCRLLVCFLMLLYGLVKLFQAQFYCDYLWRDTPLGQLSGQQLVWAMYAYAPTWERLIGLVEIGLGLLLLFPRTANLGALLFLPFAAHLVGLNFFYGIAALPTSLPLLAAAVYLVAQRWQTLSGLWRSAPNEFAAPGRRGQVLALGVVLVAICLAGAIVYNNKLRLRQDPALRGAWRLVSPQPAPLQTLYFEKGTHCVVRDATGNLAAGRYQIAGNTLTFSEFATEPLPSPASYALPDPQTLTITSGARHWSWQRISWPPLGDLP